MGLLTGWVAGCGDGNARRGALGGECENIGDCPIGRVCLQGLCAPELPCTGTPDCPTGLICVAGGCEMPGPGDQDADTWDFDLTDTRDDTPSDTDAGPDDPNGGDDGDNGDDSDSGDDSDESHDTPTDTPAEQEEEAPPAVCPLLAGRFEGQVECGGEVDEGPIFITQASDCSVVLTMPDGEQWTGSLGTTGGISIRHPRNCEGDAIGDRLRLDCGQGCSVDGERDLGQGILAVSPMYIDFGALSIGDSTSRTVRLINDGTSGLMVERVFLEPGSHPGFAVDEGALRLPRVMQPNDIIEVRIDLVAPDSLPKYGRLIVLSNSTRSSQAVDLFSGPKADACLVVLPAAINFGAAPIATPPRATTSRAALSNPCESAATVVGIRITDDAGGIFSLVASSLPPLPTSLVPGTDIPLALQCQPKADSPPGRPLMGMMTTTYLTPAGGEPIAVETPLRCTPQPPPGAVCLSIEPEEGSGIPGDLTGGPGINFGFVPLTLSDTRSLKLSNCGGNGLVIDRLRWGAPSRATCPDPAQTHCGFEANPPLPVEVIPLAAGASYELPITFTPNTVGSPRELSIWITSNAEEVRLPSGRPLPVGNTPGQVEFRLHGNGGRVGVSVDPNPLDFGQVTIGCCSRWETLTISNTGDAPLTIHNMEFAPGSHPGMTFDPQGLTFAGSRRPLPSPGNPLILRPGESATIRVRFCASDAGAATGTVVVQSDAAVPRTEVALSGEGAVTAIARDRFVGNREQPRVDILWVVDNSRSMSQEQTNLADNFNRFITTAITWGFDFQTGIVTTDMNNPAQSGRLQGGAERIMRFRGPADGPAVTAAFRRIVNVGINGASNERGIDASTAALTVPLIDDPNTNQGFMRPEAALAIIWVSDEQDGGTVPMANLLRFYRLLKGPRTAELLRAYAIVGPPGGCRSPTGNATAGTRYIDLAQGLGGFYRSICEPDFGPVFTDIGNHLFGTLSRYFLSRPAEPGTVRVTVDGQPVTNFIYNADDNTVTFPPDGQPASGADVQVEYAVVCLR